MGWGERENVSTFSSCFLLPFQNRTLVHTQISKPLAVEQGEEKDYTCRLVREDWSGGFCGPFHRDWFDHCLNRIS